jgi:hypothetical protein
VICSVLLSTIPVLSILGKGCIYLTNMNDFATVNEVYALYFAENPPARATIGVAALAKGAQVEIEVIASRRRSQVAPAP